MYKIKINKSLKNNSKYKVEIYLLTTYLTCPYKATSLSTIISIY